MRYVDPDGRYSWDQLNADLNSLCDTIKNNSVVKNLSNFINACEATVYIDFCVGAGISADVLGLGVGGDIGSEHATLALNFVSGEKPKFDYQETMSIGLEVLVTVEGSTPTPESSRSFTSSMQEEPPANGKAPIENMEYSCSYGPVALDKDGITININAGVQAVIGIEFGGEIKIPWDAWNKLWSSD